MEFARRAVRLTAWSLAILALPAVVCGQTVPTESVGERALGMGGAFVAVADDATAVWWNPAGLVTGGPAGMTIGWHGSQNGDLGGAPRPGASRQRSTLTSLATWPLGVSFSTVEVTELYEAEGAMKASSARVRQAGVSVLQSVHDRVVIGSTLKAIWGAQASGPVDGPTAGDALTSGAGLLGDSRAVFDMDVSLLARAEKVRIGLILKNLLSPNFDDDPVTPSPLPRAARMGLAILPTDGVTLAMDLDLNTVDLTGGLRQVCALGGEVGVGPRLSLRSGLRWSLKGASRPRGTVGASVRVRRALWLDGHYAAGTIDEAREGGVALRAGF